MQKRLRTKRLREFHSLLILFHSKGLVIRKQYVRHQSSLTLLRIIFLSMDFLYSEKLQGRSPGNISNFIARHSQSENTATARLAESGCLFSVDGREIVWGRSGTTAVNRGHVYVIYLFLQNFAILSKRTPEFPTNGVRTCPYTSRLRCSPLGHHSHGELPFSLHCLQREQKLSNPNYSTF